MSTNAPPTVLLTNDDGPPDPKESPYILGLYLYLTRQLGWDVKVVIPSAQKSWIGKAYHIKETVTGRYYYPREDGQQVETSDSPRPFKDGELAEWILLDGTPATCTNIGLHNLFPGQIDLVISGPNLGRNTSTAFAMSSGTIGAALSGSLSGVRAIALSYGTVLHPTPSYLFEPAHRLSAQIISHLWSHWGRDGEGSRSGEVDIYNVNIPMIEQLIAPEGMKICWTTLWRNSYKRLFKPVDQEGLGNGPTSLDALVASPSSVLKLGFRFAPDIRGLVTPSLDDLPVGTDGWALHHGWASVTPLRASFAEPPQPVVDVNQEDKVWMLKL
ncbi:hypothetical protein AX16_009566 [Volvariella volvacea WC 439]|nr:hypothetical protein AX16_009566 [Volvariella volvacea WC 439]